VHLLEESEQTEDLDGQEDTQFSSVLPDAVVGVRRPVGVTREQTEECPVDEVLNS